MLFAILKKCGDSGVVLHWRIFTHVETIYTTLGPPTKPKTTTTRTERIDLEARYDCPAAARAAKRAQVTWWSHYHAGWCRTDKQAKGMHRMAKLRERGRRKMKRLSHEN